MTKPKRRVGNPLGESGLSEEEKACWREAHHFAKLLVESSKAMVEYTEGRGVSPLGYELLQRALRLYTAQATALGIRRGRHYETDH